MRTPYMVKFVALGSHESCGETVVAARDEKGAIRHAIRILFGQYRGRWPNRERDDIGQVMHKISFGMWSSDTPSCIVTVTKTDLPD